MSLVWLAVAILPASAQTAAQTSAPTTASSAPAKASGAMERHAELGGAPPGSAGKCEIEVVVDVRAEVQIQDDSGLLRMLGGQRPQWKRFQCTSPMPLHPAGFRLTKLAGRGRIKLTLDPSQGDPAVIQIEDPQPGVANYIFDISWAGNREGKPVTGFAPDLSAARAKDPEFDRKPARPPDRGFVHPYEPEEAVHGCEDAAIDRAIERFRAQAVAIRKSALDTAPDRNEWVIGTLETRRGKDWEVYNFSCSMDFRERKVRSVDLSSLGPRK
jgi:hypothetical protein